MSKPSKEGIHIGPEVMISDLVNGLINKTLVSEQVEIIPGVNAWIENELFGLHRPIPYRVVVTDTREVEPKQYTFGITIVPPMGPAQIANSIMTSILLIGNILTGRMPNTVVLKADGVEKTI